MNPFQIILITLFIFLYLFISRSRILVLERLFTLMIVICGIVFAIFPDLTTRIAQSVGIGRGADLIFYLFILYSIFRFSISSTKQKIIEQNLTKIVRQMALSTPLHGKQKEDTSL